VRRASAISVLSAILLSLIAPALLADAESNLPSCCRRNGKHHCSMSTDGSSSGPSYRVAGMQCPSFPVPTTAPAGFAIALPGRSAAIFAELLQHPAIHPQSEARYRVSFSRSRQKRGPPAIFS
jgi:hypothetical protein